MSRKKSKKKPETVQATLGEVIADSKPKKTTKKTTKKKAASKPKRTTTKKKAPAMKKAPSEKKAPTKKKPAKKKKTPAKKKEPPKKKEVPAAPESTFSLKQLPGVGPKLEEKLKKAKYETVEKISRARSTSIAKKVDGLSKAGARKLVDAAKDLVKTGKTPEKSVETSEESPTDEVAPPRLSLTDVPGLGSKLASSMERAGYDSVARLARATPGNVAKKVDGLSSAKANSIVAAAKDLIRRQEMARLTEEPVAVIAAKPTKDAKTPPKKEEAVTETPTTPTRKKAPKKAAPKTKAPAKKKRAKKPKAPPKRIKPKAIRKESGLPVPKAVEDLAVELKEKWAAADKRVEDAKLPGHIALPQVETVQVVSLAVDDTTERIVDTALDILNDTMTSGRPAFEIPSRSGDNIVWDEIRDLLLLGMRTISRPYHSLASVVDATRTARVMEIVFNLLKSNLHATKREVYYSDVNLFREQKYSDKIIEDVASMIKTTRDSIHVVASARGSAMGRVTIRDGGDLIDLTKMGTGGWAVTPFLDQLEIVESDAEFIILSEKDAAVMRLAEAKYWNRQPCIVITGKGSGDIATRAFLKMLVKELEIPAFALVDSDPYGHYIYSVFLRGSKRLSYESPFIATPELKLLGVLSRDLDEYKIPKAVRIPMQPTDIKRVKDMLKEPFVQRNKPWVEDLELMLKLKEKAEIQAFASHSFEYLTDDYIPRKLETGDWI
ncbi:MAG: Type 2 DNA topoisomerase 6 subunit A [Candidatus Thorarchaeota archaeon AB_25]|nr:MAG: Type 2 DNA topoisomerase 6 subunit A [Candidatus Thorarchaeota archaeon AB_25]